MAKKQKLDFSGISSKPKLDFSGVGSVVKEEQDEQIIKKKVQEEEPEQVQEEVQEDTESPSEDISLESSSTDEKPKEFKLPEVRSEEDELFKRSKGYYPGEQKSFYQNKEKEGAVATNDAFTEVSEYKGVFLDTSEEDLTDSLYEASDSNVRSDIAQAVSKKRTEELNTLANTFLDKKKKSIINEIVEDNPEIEIGAAEAMASDSLFQETFKFGMSKLNLNEEDLATYKTDIENRSKDLKRRSELINKINKINSQINDVPIEQKKEFIKERISIGEELKLLKESVALSDKKIAELRENEKGFTDAEGNVNQELKKKQEDIGKRVIGFEKEYKSDYNKIYARLAQEKAKMNALRESFINDNLTPEQNLSKEDASKIPDGDDSFLQKNIVVPLPSNIPQILGNFFADKSNPELASKRESYAQAYKEAEKNSIALSRLIFLNEDPAKVERGFGAVEGESYFEIPFQEEIGQVVTSIGETLAEEVGADITSDKDFRERAINMAQQENLTLTPEQIESGNASFSEKLGEGLGVSLKIGAEIALTRGIMGGASKLVSMPKYLARVQRLRNSPKLVNFIEGTTDILLEGLAFELASESTDFAMGSAESLSNKGMDALVKRVSKSKLGKYFKFLDNYAGRFVKEVTGRASGGITEEYFGDFVSQGVKNGFFTEEQFKNVFGEGEAGMEKFFLTLGTVGMMTVPTSIVTAAKKKAAGEEEGGELSKAIKAYEESLEINPTKENVAEGLEVLKEADSKVVEGITKEEEKVLTQKTKEDGKKEEVSIEDQKDGNVENEEEAKSEQEVVQEEVLEPTTDTTIEEEVAEEGDTFTGEIKELAKEENKEVLEYIEARSAEEVSEVLDNNDLLSKVKNDESINESQAEEYTNKIYDLIDSENVVEGSVKESELYDVIEKIENYDNKTKTVKKTTAKTRLLTRFRENAGKVNEKAFRDQVSGSEAEIGGSKGVLDVKGDQVFITEKGTRRSLGKAADILTQDITTDNILKDENGTVSGVRINTPSGEMIINNPEVGLDMGIQLQEKIIGRNPLSDIEVAYENVIEEEGIEVAVEKPKPKKKAEPQLKPKTDTTIEETTTEETTTDKAVEEKVVEEIEQSFTKEEMTSKMDKTSLEKALEKVNSLDNKLKNLSLSDPFLITPAARLLLAAVKKGMKVGISLEKAISNAKKQIVKSKEYKVLRKEDQNFIDNSSLDDIVSRVEQETKGEQQKRKDTLEDELNLELEALIEESLDTKKPKTATDVRKIQKRFKDFVSANKKILRQASPALNATIANKLAGVSSPATLKSTAEYISKIIKDTNFKKEQEARAKVIGDIRKEIDVNSFRKKGGKYAQGKIAIEIDGFFEKIRNAVNFTKEQASEKTDSILEKNKDFDDISIADQEMLMALDFADLDNKSIESLNELKKTVTGYKKKGRKWLAAKKEARAKIKREGVSDLKTAVLGGDVELSPTLINSSSKTNLSTITSALSSLKKGILAGVPKIENWSGILGHINNLKGKNVGGKQKARDFLKEKFQKPIEKARSEKMRNSMEAFDAVESKKKEVFGENLKKTNYDLQLNLFITDSKGNKIKSTDGKFLSITKDQAMYIYNLQKDPSLSKTLDKMKQDPINKLLIDKANDIVSKDSKLKEYSEWVHNDFYPNYYNRINAEYRKQYDFNLPFNENYSPIRRQGFIDEGIDILSPTRNIASTLNGSLKERVKNTKALDLSMGMEGTMLGYIDSMEHFITHTDAIRFLNGTFSDSSVKGVIKQKFGNETNNIIDRFIKDLAGEPVKNRANLEWVKNLRKNYTTSALGNNPTVLLKQLTSAPAYAVAEGVNTLDYSKQAALMLTTKEGRQDLIDIYNSPYVRDRLKKSGFDRDTALSFKEDFNRITSGVKRYQNKLMFMTKFGDIGAIIMGGTPLYTSMKKKYIKQGMSEPEAESKAMLDFENATESTQQSSSVSELSDLQRGGEIMKLLTMFKTSPAQYFRKGFTSPLRNVFRGRGTVQDVKNMVMFQVILPSLFTFATKGLMSDEDDYEDYARSIAFGNLSGVPVLGDLVSGLLDKAQGKNFNSSNAIPALEGVRKAGEAILKAISDGDENIDELIDNVLLPVGEVTTGLPLKNTKKITIDNLERIGKGNYDQKKIMKMFGWSDYQLGIEKKKKSRLELKKERILEKRNKKKSKLEDKIKKRLSK